MTFYVYLRCCTRFLEHCASVNQGEGLQESGAKHQLGPWADSMVCSGSEAPLKLNAFEHNGRQKKIDNLPTYLLLERRARNGF